MVRTFMYKTAAVLELTCGEYQARCNCCTTFRNSPEQVLTRALDDNKVRDLVLERLLDDGMNVEQTLESLRVWGEAPGDGGLADTRFCNRRTSKQGTGGRQDCLCLHF